MLCLLFWTLSFFFFLKNIITCLYRKSWGVVSLASLLLFATFFLLLAPYAMKAFSIEPFLWISALLSSWLCYDLYLMKNNIPTFLKLRTSLAAAFTLSAILLIVSLSLPHAFESEPLLHIETTAEKKQQELSWKTPSGPLMRQTVSSYRVIIKNMQGADIFDDYLYGDLAAIRLKIINFPRWMQLLGFPTLWRAETISTDYLEMENKKIGPSETFALESQSKHFWQNLLWRFWNKAFFFEGKPLFIHSCTLNSTHFPLLDRKGNPLHSCFVLVLSPHSKTPIVIRDERLNIKNQIE